MRVTQQQHACRVNFVILPLCMVAQRRERAGGEDSTCSHCSLVAPFRVNVCTSPALLSGEAAPIGCVFEMFAAVQLDTVCLHHGSVHTSLHNGRRSPQCPPRRGALLVAAADSSKPQQKKTRDPMTVYKCALLLAENVSWSDGG